MRTCVVILSSVLDRKQRLLLRRDALCDISRQTGARDTNQMPVSFGVLSGQPETLLHGATGSARKGSVNLAP